MKFKLLRAIMSFFAVMILMSVLEVTCSAQFGTDELYELLLLDKKISSGKLSLIVPLGIGWCEAVPVDRGELRQWLEAAYE